MNPITNARNLAKMNERELEMGLTGTKQSWHEMYAESAWIFVGGMPYELSEGDVICVFSQYGEIVHINLIRDKDTGKSKGFGFICYEDQRSTILAVDNLNTYKLMGRTLRVDHVKDYKIPKEHEDQDEETKRLQNEGCAPRLEESSGSDEEENSDVPDAEAIEAKAVRRANRKLKKAQKKKDKEMKKAMKKEKKDEGYASQVKKEKKHNDDGDKHNKFDLHNKPSSSRSRDMERDGEKEIKYSDSKEFRKSNREREKYAHESNNDTRNSRRIENKSYPMEHSVQRNEHNRSERDRVERQPGTSGHRRRSESLSSDCSDGDSGGHGRRKRMTNRDARQESKESRSRKEYEYRRRSTERVGSDKRSRSDSKQHHRGRDDRYDKEYSNWRNDCRDRR